jgi:hypothetical protein
MPSATALTKRPSKNCSPILNLWPLFLTRKNQRVAKNQKAMKLSDIKKHLNTAETVSFKLENGTPVPEHFHVTEVAPSATKR